MPNLFALTSTPPPPAGGLAVVALACTLAAACTTNVNPGSGEPTRSGPAAGPINPSSTPGTSFPSYIPMTSSYSGGGAAMLVANRATFNTRYLGPSAPSSGAIAVASDANSTSQPNIQAPAIAGLEGSINGNLNSGELSAPIYTDIVGGVGIVLPGTVTVAGVTASPATGSVATPGVTLSSVNAPLVNGGTTTLSPVLASPNGASALATPATAASGFTLTPTSSSSAVMSPATAAATPARTGTSATSTPATAAPSRTSCSTSGSITSGTLTSGVTNSLSSSPVRVASASLSPSVIFTPRSSSHPRAVAPLPISAPPHVRAVSPTAGNTSTPPHVRAVRPSSTGDVLLTNQK